MRTHVWSGIGHDLRTVTRRLAGQPGTTSLTVLTLALSIGVAAAVFSIVDQLILRAPPFLHADRLVNVLHQTGPNRPGGGLSPEKIVGWQQQPAVFERLEGYAGASFDLTESVQPERVAARIVSLGLFDMLGIRPHIGRPFADGDGAPGSEKVAILSHEFWRARFAGSPDVLGSQIVLNDERYTVIGVLGPRTTLLSDDEAVWLPFDLAAWTASTSEHKFFFGIGRLNAALDASRARTAADAIAAQMGDATPLAGSWYLGIEQKRSAQLTPTTRQTLFVLLGAVSLLLLIACVNTTSFALVQALRRERELRLRAAIGAGRWRLLRECLVETLLLASVAALAAAAVARTALAVLLAAAPQGLAFMTTRAVEVDLRVFAIMTAAALSVGLVAGVLPGLRSSRVDLSTALRDGTRGSQRGLAFRGGIGALVAIEIAIAMVLLVGSALMARSLLAFHSLEPGFDVNKVMTVEVALPSHRYPNEQARREFFVALDGALRRQAGIEASAYAWGIPPAAGSWSARLLQAEGRDAASAPMEFFANAVSPTYFEATGTRLLAGRPFNPNDGDDRVIISEGLARLLWGDEPPVGRRLRDSPRDPWLTVIGVAGNVESRKRTGDRSDLQMYVPLAVPDSASPPSPVGRRRSYITQLLIVRAGDVAVVHSAVRQQVRLLDEHLPVGRFVSGAEIYARPLAQQQFLLTVMSVFAGVALLLAAMGIFGILSQSVTQRRREIGIRMALGASSRRVLRLLVGQGLALVAAGTVAGIVASALGVRVLEGLLFGVAPLDAPSFLSVVAVILLVALAACWWPTARALAIHPADVLRDA